MKLHQVAPAQGLAWVRLGVKTFWRQPLALAGLFFMFMLLVSALAMVPVLGQVAGMALLPAATLGLMVATREVEQGRFPMPAVLWTGFRQGPVTTRRLLILGACYALGSWLAMALAQSLIGETPVPTTGEASVDGIDLLQSAWIQQLGLSLLFYLPLGLLFWHAPALVHWHQVPPLKSLFFSLWACWHNRAALLLFFLGWTAVFAATSLFITLIATAMGGPELLATLVFPAAMLMSAMFFSSLYFTFRDSFTDDAGEPAA